jgi:acyl-CoA thioester hydrolase
MSHLSIFSYTFTIPQSVIDENGHVNNVAFVQWMQDAAIRHGQERLAGYDGYNLNTTFVLNQHATFVVREHRIEYLLPAFLGEEIEVRTWLNEARRVRLHRRYEFVRKSDEKVVAKGETDWVYVDRNTGRPIAIPAHLLELFPVLPDPSKE